MRLAKQRRRHGEAARQDRQLIEIAAWHHMTMADEDPGASSRPEQKALLGDISPVSAADTSSSAADSDQEFVDARERSPSTSTKRSSFFELQRNDYRPITPIRPVSPVNEATSLVSPISQTTTEPVSQPIIEPQGQTRERPISEQTITPITQTTAKARGKKPNVDFTDPPESSASAAAYITEGPSRPVQVRDAPLAQPSASTSGGEPTIRPVNERGNSYTNFSRPDTTRQSNNKSPTPSQPATIRTRNSITALPKRTSSISRTSVSTIKQNRQSGASTIASKKLRPPVHASDLERGQKHSSDDTAAVPPFAQGLPDDTLSRKKDAYEPDTTWLTEFYTISYLIFFAFWGTLARLGLEWLTYHPGAVITTPVVWANFAGSLVMGFLVEDSKLFREAWPEHKSSTSRAEKRLSKQSTKSRRSVFSGDFDRYQRRERLKIKARIPLYVGLTTGFCGCFTSFSLFARDMFLALSNDLPTPPYQPGSLNPGYNIARSGGYSFLALLAVIITELTLSIGGFIAGRQMALLFEDYTPRIPTRLTSILLDRLVIVLAWGCWLGSIFLVIWPPDRPGGPSSVGSWSNEYWRGVALFSMVFCPLGCLLRHYMGKQLNKLEPSFPLGTFAANLLGAAVLAACYDIQHIGIGDGSIIGGGMLSCQALEGLIDGFTGCLTTVSTFVAELDALKRKYAWIYGLSTIVAGFCLMVAIMGPVRWTVGWNNPSCIVGYPNKYS